MLRGPNEWSVPLDPLSSRCVRHCLTVKERTYGGAGFADALWSNCDLDLSLEAMMMDSSNFLSKRSSTKFL
jgi:hypothetical protein